MKLIIVEGMPGSGKSTVARFISLQSERNGYSTELVHESTLQHPILLADAIDQPAQWQAAFLSNWNKFLSSNADKESVMVFESVLFQNPIIHLLHLDIDRSDIIWFIERIMEKLSGVDSHLIYLYQNDSSIGINRMLLDRGGDIYLQKTYEKFKHFPYYINRGQTGPQLHVQFLQDYADIASQAISKCTLKTKSVENTSWNWHQDYISIMEFLGQTIHPDPELTSEELKKYVGVYRNEELGLTIQIQLIGDALIIFGNQRLKPRSAHAFYLDNISMSLRFSGEPSPKEVLIYEKDIVGNRNEHGTTFVKLP